MRYAAKRARNRAWFKAYDRVFMNLFFGPIYGAVEKSCLDYAQAKQGAFIFAGVARASAKRVRP